MEEIDHKKRLFKAVMKLFESYTGKMSLLLKPEKLDKLMDEIVELGCSENFHDYAQICCNIRRKLGKHKTANKKFKSSLIRATRKKFNKFLLIENQPVSVRFGTIRFIGALFNFQLLDKVVLCGFIKRMVFLTDLRYMNELINLTNYPTDFDDLERREIMNSQEFREFLRIYI